MELEKSGRASKEVLGPEDRIELGCPTMLTKTSPNLPNHTHASNSSLQEIPGAVEGAEGQPKKRLGPSKPLLPLTPCPSPLLCPRRSFLAALILATKFLQDRCYSNRHWAQLTGLAPREVSRCERSLGEALEWRLWVGKGSVANL